MKNIFPAVKCFCAVLLLVPFAWPQGFSSDDRGHAEDMLFPYEWAPEN